MISVITPTHNPKFLKEAYQSLLNQTYKNWEWVVGINGDVTVEAIEKIVGKDERVRVVSCHGKTGIGAIKREAFSQGRGDYLVEFDHDDLLPTQSLEKIVDAFVKTGADFVYSNCADFFENGTFHCFPEWQTNGWRYRTSKVDGKDVLECISFKPSAAAISLIYYAPNHVRVWKKDFYHKVGGHNPQLDLCDDHELVIRTYLAGKIHHIDECLYLYRMGEQNSFSKRIDYIRELTWTLHARNLEALVVRESELTGAPIYDLGGAFSCPPGFTSVDLEEPAKVRCDLSKKWPFEDNSVLAFRAHDFIEHIHDKMHVMNELHRCLKPGGWALISVPSTDGRGAFQDPTHVSYWNENSFWYYTRPEQAQYIRNKNQLFMERRLFTYFPSEFHKTHNIPYTVAELMWRKKVT